MLGLIQDMFEGALSDSGADRYVNIRQLIFFLAYHVRSRWIHNILPIRLHIQDTEIVSLKVVQTAYFYTLQFIVQYRLIIRSIIQ